SVLFSILVLTFQRTTSAKCTDRTSMKTVGPMSHEPFLHIFIHSRGLELEYLNALDILTLASCAEGTTVRVGRTGHRTL
ncbi:hypothetical protein BDR07DRAFT_1446735, partial [Suillus spraguei]